MIFCLVLLSASMMYISVELKELIDSLIENRFQAGLVLKYLAYFSPGMMKVVMPVAAVVAALITLGSMCRANEDTALKAAGVSIFRISAPLLIVTFILSGVYFVLQDYIAPYSNQKAARIRDELEGRINTATVAGMRWTFGRDSRLYGYAEYDGAKQS